MNDKQLANITRKAGYLGLTSLGFVIWAQTYAAYYDWFVVPLGAPILSIPHIYALAILARMLAANLPTTTPPKEGLLTRRLSGSVLIPIVMLGIGWVIVHWIGI